MCADGSLSPYRPMDRTVSIPARGLADVELVCGSEATDWLYRAEEMLDGRRLSEACEIFHQAEAMGASPDRCGSGRWMTAMLRGDFEAAWRESDAIRMRGTPDPHRFWNGEDLRGARVMVRCLHGFGDAVQMLRYAPWLREIASRVIFEVPQRMLSLAPLFRGVDEVITWGEAAPEMPPEWDVQVEVTELPYLFRTTLDDLPITTHYLALPDATVQQTADAMGSAAKPRIGLVWASGEWNPERSIPLALFEPMICESSVEFWSLQGDVAAAEAEPWIDAGMVRDATAICGDGLVALAATIANLDLVITVDTLAAHLAGALGKPAWVMLQYAADWRWMTARDDTPWYPMVRLFRQPKPGDWSGTVAAVQEALSKVPLIAS
jgi:hypothetical protein